MEIDCCNRNHIKSVLSIKGILLSLNSRYVKQLTDSPKVVGYAGRTAGTIALRQWQTYKKSESGNENVIINPYQRSSKVLFFKKLRERERERKLSCYYKRRYKNIYVETDSVSNRQ